MKALIFLEELISKNGKHFSLEKFQPLQNNKMKFYSIICEREKNFLFPYCMIKEEHKEQYINHTCKEKKFHKHTKKNLKNCSFIAKKV